MAFPGILNLIRVGTRIPSAASTCTSGRDTGPCFCGIYHTHYPGDKELSIADEEYIRAILIACQDSANVLYFPLVFPGKEMIIYKAVSYNSEIIISGEDIIIINERK